MPRRLPHILPMNEDRPARAGQTHAVKVAAAGDGVVTYLVDRAPGALPAVQRRDLEAAWEAARGAAGAARWSIVRAFRFRRTDGSFTDLALSDRDAQCWAGAVDAMVGLGSLYGMSLCLRLLALIDLLARAPWTSGFFALEPDGATLHPALLREAASARLTEEARFDERSLRARLLVLPAPVPSAAHS